MITYEYKLYRTKRTRHLDDMLREACFVWNHALSLQKRYYRMYGKYIPCARMQKHFAKRIRRYYLNSQSNQEIVERLDAAYSRFFKHKAKRPPKFKKHEDFRSFVFKQSGFSLCGSTFHLNSVKKDYRFSYSRPYEGKVKQVRLKRSPKGEWHIYIVTDAKQKPCVKTHDGASTGIDFGLKTYMTFSDGTNVKNPQFLKSDLNKLRQVAIRHSTKAKDSNHRKQARQRLDSWYGHVSNKRKDFQWKLAHDLCRKYDYIFIEDLSLTGMVRRKHWGRKMNDLAHGQFVAILEQVAPKYGVVVHKIDRWFPSSKLCDCGYKNTALTLNDREWTCPVCGRHHDRDVHAAQNILRRGIYELGSGSKTKESPAEGLSAKAS